ncbi:hypothetical protein ANO11243_019620 [Dothideomycetidae sp. 11243]|nr:hypothetical protein ANO11243_019620 [fungal sp. No.11243]
MPSGLTSTPTTNLKSPLCQVTTPSGFTSATKKRSFESPSSLDNFDYENLDPGVFLSPSKKSKGNDGITKPSTFLFTKAPPMHIAKELAKPSTPKITNSSPRAPSTAPVGRSPPRKARVLDPKRRTSAPYTRIDPPSSSRKAAPDTNPFFSFEEALAGTRNRAMTSVASSNGLNLDRGMPKSWFFNIHEDTPEQEAQNLMEHSATLLDISSDEESTKAKNQDCGKENVAPSDFVAAQPSAIQVGKPKSKKGKAVQRRRKVVKPDAMDDGERSPLSEVEREDFFPEGVTADQVVIVDAELDSKKDVAIEPTASTASVTPTKADALSDIVIFEDAA